MPPMVSHHLKSALASEREADFAREARPSRLAARPHSASVGPYLAPGLAGVVAAAVLLVIGAPAA
jgi:hypothetical protein